MSRGVAFALGLIVGSLAYPVGRLIGDECVRRNGGYAFGVK